MRSGIVMEIGDKHIIVMTPDGHFKRIARGGRSYAVGEEIALARRFAFSARISPVRWTGYASAAALLVVLFASIFLFGGEPVKAVAYVTVDINPSLEVGIDASEKVVETRGLDEEGRALAELIEYEGLSLEQYTAALFARILENPSFNVQTATILVTGTVVDERSPLDSYELAEKVKRQIVAAADGSGTGQGGTKPGAEPENSPAPIAVTTLSAPKEVRIAAIETGVSTGKLAVQLLAGKEQEKIQIDELKTKSVGQILQEYGGAERIIPADRAAIGKELIDLLGKLPADAFGNKSGRNKENPAEMRGSGNPGHEKQGKKEGGKAQDQKPNKGPDKEENKTADKKMNLLKNNGKSNEKGSDQDRMKDKAKDKTEDKAKDKTKDKTKEKTKDRGNSKADSGANSGVNNTGHNKENSRESSRAKDKAKGGTKDSGNAKENNGKNSKTKDKNSGNAKKNNRDSDSKDRANNKASNKANKNADNKADSKADRNADSKADNKSDGQLNRNAIKENEKGRSFTGGEGAGSSRGSQRTKETDKKIKQSDAEREKTRTDGQRNMNGSRYDGGKANQDGKMKQDGKRGEHESGNGRLDQRSRY